MILQNGHVIGMTLAVLDVRKEDEKGNDSHGSKIIVVPFDGGRFGPRFEISMKIRTLDYWAHAGEKVLPIGILFLLSLFVLRAESIPLSGLDLTKVQQDSGKARSNLSVDGKPLTIADQVFPSGLGTHANSILFVSLKKVATHFTASVGVDDEMRGKPSSVIFNIKGDGKTLWTSGLMKSGDKAKPVDVNLSGIDLLILSVTDGDDGINSDHADWGNANFEVTGPGVQTIAAPVREAVILTPKTAATPRINGPSVFGVRPGSPFLYSIPATGDRPMTFSVEGLPEGLKLDTVTGRITGSLKTKGEISVTLRAQNALGADKKKFRIVVGDEIALTPPMGWNSYNCFGVEITQDKALRAARALIAHGLDRHGWTYINLDDGWQGRRSGPNQALQPDPERFTDIAAMVGEIHSLGLKAGIYHTPWTISYGKRLGGSSENADGAWPDKANFNAARNRNALPYAIGAHSFVDVDARQFASWGMDYLKYDWGPVDVENTRQMSAALRGTGRDIMLSLSNNAAYNMLPIMSGIVPLVQAWRTTNDINDSWNNMSGIGFNQEAWASFQKPGHYNDTDMLVVGNVGGWSGHTRLTKLTPDEQYTHISLWCLLGAPLLIGCDLEKLDDFTLNLLTNDEVLAVDQDSLCKQGYRVSSKEGVEVYAKPLEDGSLAVGLFNRNSGDDVPVTVLWSDLKISGRQSVRDLWRQKDLGLFTDKFEATVAPHGVLFVKIFRKQESAGQGE